MKFPAGAAAGMNGWSQFTQGQNPDESDLKLTIVNGWNHYGNVRLPFSFGSCGERYSLRIDNQGVPPMKRLILSAVALSMLALPISQAQAGPRHEPPRYERQDSQWNKRPSYDNHYKYKKKVVKKHRWERGHRVPAWQRKHVVKDYHRYGLRRPAHGQQWVKVDNDFLLISIASGLIGGIIASQY